MCNIIELTDNVVCIVQGLRNYITTGRVDVARAVKVPLRRTPLRVHAARGRYSTFRQNDKRSRYAYAFDTNLVDIMLLLQPYGSRGRNVVRSSPSRTFVIIIVLRGKT